MTTSRVLIPARRHRYSGIATLLIASAVLALAGCGGSSNDDVSSAVQNNERTVGNPAVFARIETSTNCAALEREWSNALGNAHSVIADGGNPVASQAYMTAVVTRKRQIGCYG